MRRIWSSTPRPTANSQSAGAGVPVGRRALCFLVVNVALLQWKGPEARSGFPLENFLESFSTAVRYVRYSPAIQVVLARNVLFAFFISRSRTARTNVSSIQFKQASVPSLIPEQVELRSRRSLYLPGT
jgi:Transmembrane secretion effector